MRKEDVEVGCVAELKKIVDPVEGCLLWGPDVDGVAFTAVRHA